MGIVAIVHAGRVLTEHSEEAKALVAKGRFGQLQDDGRVELNAYEACFLVQEKRITVVDNRNRPHSFEGIFRKLLRGGRDAFIRYRVFADLRKRGYTVKSALKFGADFRVYDRNAKDDDHARWVLYVVKEADKLTWHGFAAKTRVAHSTKKQLLIAVVDDDGDISYWESRWLRP
jgi:tRNA-intron endonuclease